jgi:hypothetical protein
VGDVAYEGWKGHLQAQGDPNDNLVIGLKVARRAAFQGTASKSHRLSSQSFIKYRADISLNGDSFRHVVPGFGTSHSSRTHPSTYNRKKSNPYSMIARTVSSNGVSNMDRAIRRCMIWSLFLDRYIFNQTLTEVTSLIAIG